MNPQGQYWYTCNEPPSTDGDSHDNDAIAHVLSQVLQPSKLQNLASSFVESALQNLKSSFAASFVASFAEGKKWP